MFENKLIKKILMFLPIILLVISFILGVTYNKNNKLMNKFNVVLSGRLSSSNNFLKDYKLNLLGNKISLVGTRQAKQSNIDVRILDMGYIHLGVRYGIIILCLFIYVLTYIQYYSIKNKDYKTLFCNTFFIIVGFAETYIFVLTINFILFKFMYIYEENRKLLMT